MLLIIVFFYNKFFNLETGTVDIKLIKK